MVDYNLNIKPAHYGLKNGRQSKKVHLVKVEFVGEDPKTNREIKHRVVSNNEVPDITIGPLTNSFRWNFIRISLLGHHGDPLIVSAGGKVIPEGDYLRIEFRDQKILDIRELPSA